MTEPTRISAAAGLPTPVDDGTPAGLPTPAGEPVQQSLPLKATRSKSARSGKAARSLDLSRPVKPGKADNDVGEKPRAARKTKAHKPPAPVDPVKTPCYAIGALVMAWGALEAATAGKLVAMRRSYGDVRAVGGRSRPTLQRLLAELRAFVAMRDRHDKQVLTVIAALDGDLQRLAQFRNMVVDGAKLIDRDVVVCHDLKNVAHHVPARTIAGETRRIEAITAQIAAL